MIFKTDRLVLSTWQSSDWIALRPIATDAEVMRYITGGVPWTDERIQLFVNRQMELFLARGFCRWKLLVKPTEEMIGFCGVGFWGDELEAEIGWWLHAGIGGVASRRRRPGLPCGMRLNAPRAWIALSP